MSTEAKRVAYLRRRAYQEGQHAAIDAENPYYPGSLNDAWAEGHKDVHFYGIKKFRPTPNEKLAWFVGFILVVISVTTAINYLIRN